MAILLIVILVLVNGFFVASEFSLVSLRSSRLDELIKERKMGALQTKWVTQKLDDMLSVCQVGITVASLILGWIGEEYFAQIFTDFFRVISVTVSDAAIHTVSVSIAFTLITFLHIMLGEQIPKTIAIRNAENVALIISGPMTIFYYLFLPITFVMNRFTNGFLNFFNIEIVRDKHFHSPEELMIIIEEQSKQGKIDKEEMQIIQKTFNFSENTAEDVMTHRSKITGIPHDMPIENVLSFIATHTFSRYPIYEGTMDKITGVIHVQSYIKWKSQQGKKKDKIKVQSLAQVPIFVPETLSIEKVLQKLRSSNQHMAIVIDEYGGVAGLLTMEDIIEEIFGEIQDETDVEEKSNPNAKRSKTFVIDGETELDELSDILEGLEEKEKDDVRTIAGLFVERLEDMPKEGSVIKIPKGELRVKKMDGNKIMSLQFTFGNGKDKIIEPEDRAG
jgi:CBS domain containing-hemolysin-like protein